MLVLWGLGDQKHFKMVLLINHQQLGKLSPAVFPFASEGSAGRVFNEQIPIPLIFLNTFREEMNHGETLLVE